MFFLVCMYTYISCVEEQYVAIDNTPRNEVRGGYTGITLSVCLSVDARAVR